MGIPGPGGGIIWNGNEGANYNSPNAVRDGIAEGIINNERFGATNTGNYAPNICSIYPGGNFGL